MKIDPKTAEKRLRHFAPPIRHDQAHYQHAFDHRGPWYRHRSAILATYGAAGDGVLWARKRLGQKTPAIMYGRSVFVITLSKIIPMT